ncbi:MAG TPA: periplasmic nitrate reductase, NapE protein [Usitatibacter sp.]|jgi:nitrate reductase NapE|nr:periplasmic nitrate reductase, NapE protein [Usitatibacter sp.]
MPPPSDQAASKSEELKAFVFFTFVVAPAMAGVIVGTYGLVVWIYQMFAGPPTG